MTAPVTPAAEARDRLIEAVAARAKARERLSAEIDRQREAGVYPLLVRPQKEAVMAAGEAIHEAVRAFKALPTEEFATALAESTARTDEAERDRDEARAELDAVAKVVRRAAVGEWTDAFEAMVEESCAAEERAEAATARIAALEAEVKGLHRDNERLRWRHPGVLPAWNDLSNKMRKRLADEGRWFDPSWGADLVATLYGTLHNTMRDAAALQPNPGGSDADA